MRRDPARVSGPVMRPRPGDPRHERRRLRIGRDPTRVDFVISGAHDDVGRHQADIVQMHDGRVYLVPQPSTNPSRVDRQTLAPGEAAQIRPGDEVQFGTYRLDLRVLWSMLDSGRASPSRTSFADEQPPARQSDATWWPLFALATAVIGGTIWWCMHGVDLWLAWWAS